MICTINIIKTQIIISGGSRISRCGGAPTHWGGTNLQRIYFSVKMYAKTKEIDPVGGGGGGGGGRQRRPLDPPMIIKNIKYGYAKH